MLSYLYPNAVISVPQCCHICTPMLSYLYPDAVISVPRCCHICTPMLIYLYPDAVISVTQRSLHMNKFYVIIYHPSRFICITHLNILIYRHLNSVIDTSETEISITLSITIWGYPSRFSHYTLSDTGKRLRVYTLHNSKKQ